MTTQASLSRPSRKRETVLDAAHECFLEHGYAATSMDMVASRAGVSKATIYAYFSGKSDLFSAVIHSRCVRVMLTLPPPESGDARAVLTTVGTHLLNKLLNPEIMSMYRVVVAEASRYPELARAYWEAGPSQGKAWLVDMFERLHREGSLRIDCPYRAVDQFLGLLRGDLFYRALLDLPPNDQDSVEATVASTVEVMCRAYAPADAAAPYRSAIDLPLPPPVCAAPKTSGAK